MTVRELIEHLQTLDPEWSEEDEALIENVCTALKGYALHERKVYLDEHAHRLEEMSERLKSLRPQTKGKWTKRLEEARARWKPSEEQMTALAAAKMGVGPKYELELLESLYEQLKAL